MKDNASLPLSVCQRKGRRFFITALVLLGLLYLNGMVKGVLEGDKEWVGNGMALILAVMILVLAYRGGRISLILVRIVAGLFGAVGGILVLVISATLAMGRPLPESPGVENTLPVLGALAATGFCLWALFFSRDVREFVEFQREKSHARKLLAIKESVLKGRLDFTKN